MNMDIQLARHSEKLFYFYHVAKHQGLQEVSRRLNISSPTLSYNIKELEKAIGLKLFLRSSNKMIMTHEGQILFGLCSRFFIDLENVTAEIKNEVFHKKTKIRIGTFQSIAIYLWPALLKKIGDQSNIIISFTTDRSRRIEESLYKKDIDIALTVGGMNHPKISRHLLYSDHFEFFSSSKQKKQNLSIDEIKNYNLLYIPDSTDEQGMTLQQHCHNSALHFKSEFHLDSFEIAAEFAKNEIGLALLPSRVGRGYSKLLSPIKIDGVPGQFGTHHFYLSYRKDLELSQLIIGKILKAAKDSVQEFKHQR